MSHAPLGRRAFLCLATRGRERVLEISCERLHVRWVDAPATTTPRVLAQAITGWREEPGEPPTMVFLETRDELLRQLDACLSGAKVLRLLEPEWLGDPDLRREVETRIAEFRRRGGRVVSTRVEPRT